MVGSEVVVFSYVGVNKMFIVIKIKVGFSVVIGNKYFIMLDRVYSVWVDIDVRVEF